MAKKSVPPKTVDPVHGNAPDVLPGLRDRRALVEDSQRANRKLADRLEQSRSELADEIQRKQAAEWASSARATVGHYSSILQEIALQPVRGGRAPRDKEHNWHDAIISTANKLLGQRVEKRNLVSETAARERQVSASTIRRVLHAEGLIDPPKKRASKKT
jgi:hypothetical protein